INNVVLFLCCRVELCSFSGYKIYPGHGRRYARIDGKVFQFLNAKCESAFLSKRNPRQINWTVLYRRKHKKGQSEEVTKKRTRRAVKFQRAITGASLAEILAKRNQKPEVRKAQREQAIRAAKEAKKAKQATKKAAAPPAKVSAVSLSLTLSHTQPVMSVNWSEQLRLSGLYSLLAIRLCELCAVPPVTQAPVSFSQVPTKAATKQKIAKPMKVSAPRVGGKR
ncbi:60S ribosomal protein L24-like, partial [Scleropages formosus]